MRLGDKMCVLDLETFPWLAYGYGNHYEPVIVKELEKSAIVSISYCFGDGPIQFKAVWDFKGWKPGLFTIDDKPLIEFIAKEILPKADVICGHNSDSFDIKTIQERMYFHKIPPSKIHKTKDTLKLHRKYFKNPSNKLNYLAEAYGEQGKVSHEGAMTYVKAALGDEKLRKILKKYNKRDVEVTRERLKEVLEWENRLAPVWEGNRCECGGKLIKRGEAKTIRGRFQKFQCTTCAHYSQGKQIIKQPC